jgi:hypothetical protein
VLISNSIMSQSYTTIILQCYNTPLCYYLMATCFGRYFTTIIRPIWTVYVLYVCMLWDPIVSTIYRYNWNSFLHTVHVVLSSSAQKPRLPHQQDIIPYVVKKTSVLRSWRWAKFCPKHVELILKINKNCYCCI